MPFQRCSGILLHPTSLPGPFGVGDLGPSAYTFIDFLIRAGQRLWQILPLSPTGFGNSPYMSFSAMAGNPLLISPELLAQEGWLDPQDWLMHPNWAEIQKAFVGQVDFELVIPFKQSLLSTAFLRFQATATAQQRQELHSYCATQAWWLEDYALFMALKDVYQGQEWITWETGLALRDPQALAQARITYAQAIALHQFTQFQFDRQWQTLKTYANQFAIEIVGDIPIYVAFNSADVWANALLFELDKTGLPSRVAGVPPDYFSPTGQRWGNPLYNWAALQTSGYSWWVNRFQRLMQWVDWVRLDHFRGFESYWAVLAEEETAENGRWVKGPGADLFTVLEQRLGTLPIIAEDLGDITPEVIELRDQFQFPGMRVLEFAFGDHPGNPFLPHNYDRNAVVYTGTHDNDTVVGWFYGGRLSTWEQNQVRRYLGCHGGEGIHWDLIRLAMRSVANVAIIPLQDVMGLGTDSRMNTPGTTEGNWCWRYTAEMITQGLVDQLSDQTLLYGRIPSELLHQQREALQKRHNPDPVPPDAHLSQEP